jgi:hypothetical protein
MVVVVAAAAAGAFGFPFLANAPEVETARIARLTSSIFFMLTLPGKKDAPAVEHKAHITASWSAALPRDGRGSFLLAAGVSSARRRTGMQGSLGEKIGEGVFADVHAWAPGQVVKLSKPGIPQWVVQHETQMTRAVFAAGGPAPEVLGFKRKEQALATA